MFGLLLNRAVDTAYAPNIGILTLLTAEEWKQLNDAREDALQTVLKLR